MLKKIINVNIRKKKKGQSTLEYIILVAAIVAALLIFLPTGFRTAFNQTLTTGTDGMINMAQRLNSSRP